MFSSPIPDERATMKTLFLSILLLLHIIPVFSQIKVKKKLHFFPFRSSWNSYAAYCSASFNGGQLLRLDNVYVDNALKYFITTHWANRWMYDDKIWYGMYISQEAQILRWQRTCTYINYTQIWWTKPELDESKMCGVLDSNELIWDFETCGAKLDGICEENIGECTFERMESSCLPVSTINENYTKTLRNVDECEDYCNTVVLETTELCWAYSFIFGLCYVHTSINPYSIIYDDSFSCVNSTYGKKHCFEGSINTAAIPHLNETKPMPLCAENTRTQNHLANETQQTKKSIGEIDTSTFQSHLTEAQLSITTSSSHQQIDNDTLFSTRKCSCLCSNKMRNLTKAVLTKKIAKIRKELTVNKTSLRSLTASKTSAKDERPSAKGIGLVFGVGILSSVGAVLVIPDMISAFAFLYKKIKNALDKE